MSYMGNPPGSLWQSVRNINDQRILANIRGLYGKHFPIEIRDQLAEWIESQRWHELDPSILVHQQEAQQLYGDMLTQLRSIKDHMRDFTEKMKWEDILDKLQANFDSNPFNLVEQMQSILKTERQFLKEYQGANMSPQPSPAASHHSTNSPDPSKLVHSPPGSQLTGNSHEAIGQSIQKICVMTHEAEGLLKSLEHQQEYFIIHINESHKLQAMVTHHSQQPVNPQVVQALRLKLQETEIALNKEVEALQQNRISITQQFHMLLGDLGSIIHSVVNDELVGWKRIQNQALGLDSSPPADDLLVVLQGWFETLAELLWRNKQFIKQYYRLKSQLPMNGTEIPEDYNQTVDNLIVFLLRNSFVVEKQPPQVLKTNTRFSSTVRLMVGGKLNIHMNPPEVIATIISEKQAKGLAANPDTLQASDISCGQMLNNKRAMEYNPTSQILSATFSNMSVKNIKRLEKKGSETVTDEKCAILLRSNIILPGSDVYFHVSTISLPVAVVVHGSQLSSAEGTMFWDKAFSDVNREPFVVPVQVPWPMLAKALNAYFFNTTGGSLPEICIDYLWKKIPNVNTEENGSGVITWQSFNKENLHVAPGKRREPFTFFDWFYGICELLKKHLSGFWKESLIFGFMGKLQAQEILINQRVGTFLLRFSETETGGISVAWVTQDANGDKKVWFLSPWFVKDLQIRPFADRLRDLTELTHVYSTHGQCYEKHAAFTKYYSPPTEDTNKGPLDYVTAQMKITLNTSDKLGDKGGNNGPGEYTDLRGQMPMKSMSDSRSSLNSPQNIPSNISTFSSNHSPSSTNMAPIHHQQHPLLRDLPTNLVYSDEIMPDEFDADEVDMILSGHMTHNF